MRLPWRKLLELFDVACRHLCYRHGIGLDVFSGQVAQPPLQFKLVSVGDFREAGAEGVPQQMWVERRE